MSIAKLNTELLGGEIYANSIVGKGSVFSFSIPYNPVIQKKKKLSFKKDAKPRLEEYKILIVEDEEINFLFIKEVLSRTGIKCNILEATNGQEAVDVFKRNSDISLVLMDLKMPVMNGYDATRKIKQINPDIPVVIQTAYTLEEERQKSKDAGCNDFITKPIKIKELKEVLNRNLEL